MKLKAWFAYSGSPGWFHCTMILENGWAPWSHLCSHPNFAPGDLFIGRKERMELFKKLGIEIDLQGIVSTDEVPKEVVEKNKDKNNYRQFSEELAASEV